MTKEQTNHSLSNALTSQCIVEFRRADDPPERNTLVMCTDGVGKMGWGFYIGDRSPEWVGFEFKMGDRLPISIDKLPWVKVWAYLPVPSEAVAGCYPDRVCRVCGRTQEKIDDDGSGWLQWDLCGRCFKPIGSANRQLG